MTPEAVIKKWREMNYDDETLTRNGEKERAMENGLEKMGTKLVTGKQRQRNNDEGRTTNNWQKISNGEGIAMRKWQ